MWWRTHWAGAELAIARDLDRLRSPVESLTALERDERHGRTLSIPAHEALAEDAAANRRWYRRGWGWNESGIVLVPHQDGLCAYWTDRAESEAYRERRIGQHPAGSARPSAIGPASGVLVVVQDPTGHTLVTRRSSRCGSRRGWWGLSAGESLTPADVAGRRLDPRAATLRAVDEELAIGADAVLEVEPVGIARTADQGHHLVTIAHTAVGADELAGRAFRARDAWEWDAVEPVELSSDGLDRVAAMEPMLPTASAVLVWCAAPSRLTPLS